jgi:copper/silver efflux system protein
MDPSPIAMTPANPSSPTPSHTETWVERTIEWSARNKFMVFMMVGALFISGLYCLRNTPLDAIPDLSDVQVIVFTQWEGRSPNLVEDQITYPLVTRLVGAPKVRVARGYSFFGYSFVYVIFEDGTDIYWARSRVLEYLQGSGNTLPPGVTPTLGPDASGVGWGFQYALVDRGGQHDLADLRAFQDWHLRYWLQSIEGVAEVATFGGFEKQYQVELDPDRLFAYNLPLDRVINAIRSANNDVGGRELERYGTTYLVRGHGYMQSLEDLRLVVVGTDNRGTPILLRDMARNIALGPEMRRGAGDFDGEGETVGGIVVVRHGQNVLQVIDRMKQRLADISALAAAGRRGCHHLRPVGSDPPGHPHPHAHDQRGGAYCVDCGDRLPARLWRRCPCHRHAARRRRPCFHSHVLSGSDGQHHVAGGDCHHHRCAVRRGRGHG